MAGASLYRYTPRRYPTPGTGNYAFEPKFSLSKFPLLAGPGKVTMGQINPLQPPQTYYYMQAPTAGLGGVQAGQIVGQPLLSDLSPASGTAQG